MARRPHREQPRRRWQPLVIVSDKCSRARLTAFRHATSVIPHLGRDRDVLVVHLVADEREPLAVVEVFERGGNVQHRAEEVVTLRKVAGAREVPDVILVGQCPLVG